MRRSIPEVPLFLIPLTGITSCRYFAAIAISLVSAIFPDHRSLFIYYTQVSYEQVPVFIHLFLYYV